MPVTTYGDVSPRTAAKAVKDMLAVSYPLESFGKFMQGQTLPENNTNSLKWRRWNKLPLITTAAVEGVTPTSDKLTATDVSLTLKQFIGIVEITDVVADTHEDPVLKIAVKRSGERMTQSIETDRFNTLKAGTNKFYANGTARTDVNTAVTANLIKKMVRSLNRQDTSMITEKISSTPKFNTENVLPSLICIGHTDLKNDIKGLTGFINAKEYGSTEPYPGEIGAVDDVRFILTNICTPYADGGGAKGAMVSTTGTSADVYSLIMFGKDAWDSVALRGEKAIVPMVLNPNVPRGGDPAGQRGSVAAKTMFGTIILNDAWMAVAEVAATDL